MFGPACVVQPGELMLPALVIILVMACLGAALWVAQAYRMLGFAAIQVESAWEELRAALVARREMVPYIVASVPINISPALDVIGNACDLAANVTGIQDCSQAEARLSAAITRLFAQFDAEADLETREALLPLRERLAELEMKLGMLKQLYNGQAGAYNALMKQGGGRILMSIGAVRARELF